MRFIVLCFFLLGWFSSHGQIKISAQKDFKFSHYKTFTVQKGQIISSVNDRKINENTFFKVLKESVTREMNLRGYSLADDSTAELIITYVFQEADRSTYEKPGPLGQTPKDDPADVDEGNRSSILQTLILEIVDRKNNNSLWTATCPLQRASRDVYSVLDETTIHAFQKLSKLKGGRKP
jgi:hypothetical protein